MRLEKMENFTGRLWVHSIEKLFLGNNIVSFIARVQGKDLAYMRKIAGYPAAVKFGAVDLTFDCSASLSFRSETAPSHFQAPDSSGRKGK